MDLRQESDSVEPQSTLSAAAGTSPCVSPDRIARPALSFVPPADHCFEGLVGRSPGMRRLFDQISIVARRFRIASLEGEDGTGKTSVARILHHLSPAAARPFFPCLAASFLPPGDPTGGWDAEILESVQGGTLFLERTHELESHQQPSLSRFLVWLEHQQIHRSAAPETSSSPPASLSAAWPPPTAFAPMSALASAPSAFPSPP